MWNGFTGLKAVTKISFFPTGDNQPQRVGIRWEQKSILQWTQINMTLHQ
jgi:hypothetical protein